MPRLVKRYSLPGIDLKVSGKEFGMPPSPSLQKKPWAEKWKIFMHISTKLNSFHRSPPDSNINLGTFHDKGVGGGEGWKGKNHIILHPR